MHEPSDPSTSPASRREIAVVVAAVLAGAALRLYTLSDLWLDEALSVNIASLPLSDLPEALRRDGHPPLYYVLLHGWMELVGDGDTAVRILSGLISLATLPLLWAMARRRGGPVAGLAALALAAANPFAVRYATEARMYSLVILLAALGWWFGDRLTAGRGSAADAIGLSVVATALLYTHYWSVWLLGTGGIVLLVVAVRAPAGTASRRGARQGIAALVVAGLCFLPWLPVMLDQLAHTGTPWGAPQRTSMAVALALFDFVGGGVATEGSVGLVLMGVLVLLAVTGRPDPPHRIAVDVRTVPGIRTDLLVAVGALAIGASVAWVTGATFASRYAAIALPVFVVAGGLGVATGPSPRARTAMLVATLAVLGGASLLTASDQRTQGTEVAAAINQAGADGDLVVMCPDQLGPAASRHLDEGLEALTLPLLAPPELVDWRDYATRNAAADPELLAAELLDRAGDGTIWLVWMPGYATYDQRCESVRTALAGSRPVEVVLTPRSDVFEPMWLERLPAA